MITFDRKSKSLLFDFSLEKITAFSHRISQYTTAILITILYSISAFCFLFFLSNRLGLAYNDARSHLDIGRRVVEGLKPGLAQLGSVWLPLPHLLMVPTIWSDFMWHSGLAGALQSMIAFVVTGMLVYQFLKKINVGMIGRLIGVFIWVANVNVLYLQSTAMTELLLLATMTAGVYYLLLWQKEETLINLIKSAFWIMLATLVRYDGWFLLLMAVSLIALYTLRKRGYKVMEGTTLFFLTLCGFGIVLWFLWNQLIFKDALYFMFGPYSAHAQQKALSQAGVLTTKGNFLLSVKTYSYALAYNSNTFILLLAALGSILFFIDKKIKPGVKIISTALFAPLFFNILALYLGFSVLFIQGLNGDTWFNARYGIMLMPTIAIFVGFLFEKARTFHLPLIGLILFVTFFTFASGDGVTIDDARVGASQKNVTQISHWLSEHAKNQKGFILISAASHDAIIFSSGLPMSRFIHEGTGKYWESATTTPDRWARWIVMRTHDNNDQTFKLVSKTSAFSDYRLIETYPFADIYEIKPEFIKNLNTEAIIKSQK